MGVGGEPRLCAYPPLELVSIWPRDIIRFVNILFPQWQGAGNRPELHRGALELAPLRPDLDWQRLDVSAEYSETKYGVNAYAEVNAQLGRATAFLDLHQPDTLFTLGGDCSIELAPISYLNARYPGLGVIWFDAHADLANP